jgi:hypothetical protein
MAVLYHCRVLVGVSGFSRVNFIPGLHLSQAQGLPETIMFDPFRVWNDINYPIVTQL